MDTHSFPCKELYCLYINEYGRARDKEMQREIKRERWKWGVKGGGMRGILESVFCFCF
jgi:hypothetical protein